LDRHNWGSSTLYGAAKFLTGRVRFNWGIAIVSILCTLPHISKADDCYGTTPLLNTGDTVRVPVAINTKFPELMSPSAAATYLEIISLQRLQDRGSGFYDAVVSILQSYPRLHAVVIVQDPQSDVGRALIESMHYDDVRGRMEFLVDDSGIGSLFGVPQNCDASYLIDSTHVIRFNRMGGMRLILIQKLAEKYASVVGANAHTESDVAEGQFAVGGHLPDLSFVSAQNGGVDELSHLTRGSGLAFLFTAECKRCELAGFLSRLEKLQRFLPDSTQGTSMCFFEPGLDLDTLRAYLKNYHISLASFVQIASAKALSADNMSLLGKRDIAAVVRWDSAGTVVEREDFEDYIRKLIIPGKR
jgi:hypothetical protein